MAEPPSTARTPVPAPRSADIVPGSNDQGPADPWQAPRIAPGNPRRATTWVAMSKMAPGVRSKFGKMTEKWKLQHGKQTEDGKRSYVP